MKQWVVTGENPFLSIEEFYLVQNPSADSFSWDGSQFTGRLTLNIPWDVEIKTGYTYSDKTYPGVESMGLDGLLRVLAHFSERLAVVERVRTAASLQAHTSRSWGPALVFGRLWEAQGLPALLARQAAGRRFEFDVERAG